MIPTSVQRHLQALGVGEVGLELLEREINKAVHMNRDELRKAVEVKNNAIRYLRIQQAVYLALLETT